MVRTERLELSHLAAPEPKSGVSTNSTTSAFNLGTKQKLTCFVKYGVDDGFRTHDTGNHNPVLYQLSYAHHIALCILHVTSSTYQLRLNGAPGRIRTCDHPLRRRVLYPTELRAPGVCTQFELLTQGSITVQYDLFSFRIQLQAVLGKRGEYYIDHPMPSTTIFKRIN